jgi:thiol-disulfide isomerase/thioredoxin
MKSKLWIASLTLIACATPVVWAANENAAPAVAATSAESAPAAKADVKAELNALVARIQVKIKAGARTEAALAEEMKGFDAILAAHKDEKTDDVARVLMMKAMLYVEIFKDFEKGSVLLTQVKTDFPQTPVAQNIDKILEHIAQQKEAAKMAVSLAPGVVFPDFEEKDLSGQPLSIAKFKGKIVLVDFWATWCGPCVAELPNVMEAYKKYHDKGFEIVGISLDQDEAKLKAFISEKGMVWPQYFDGKGWGSKLGKKYGILSIPATFLLDKDGKIIAKGLRGPALDAELEKQLGK